MSSRSRLTPAANGTGFIRYIATPRLLREAGRLLLMHVRMLLVNADVIVASIGVGVVFAGFAYALRALTPLGAMTGGGLAACLVGLGGWEWIVPGVTFFVLSSALSKVGTRRKERIAHRIEKGNVRDAQQVLANGGVAWILLLVWGLDATGDSASLMLYAGGCGAFAAAAADTWATEIGTLSQETPRSIVTGRKVPTGTSGAVSWTGTIGGLCGAGSVATSVALVVSTSETALLAVAITASGGIGMLADSLAGATIQARYRDPKTGVLTERPPQDDVRPSRGWKRVNNDVVNWIGTGTGAVVAMVVLWIVDGMN